MSELGRPSLYSDELADEICRKLSEGMSLNRICQAENFPAESTVRAWALDDYKGFSAKYTRARDLGLDALADEVMAIADDGSEDITTRYNEKGEPYEVTDQEHIARSRLRFDARRWYLSKLAPKKYGDRTAVEHSGPGGKPIPVIISSVLDE